MKTCIVLVRVSALTPSAFICMILSVSVNAEFSTTVTISNIALVIMPESRPHICSVSAGNCPSHALMHLPMLPGLPCQPHLQGV